jgi:hypothetical protein
MQKVGTISKYTTAASFRILSSPSSTIILQMKRCLTSSFENKKAVVNELRIK